MILRILAVIVAGASMRLVSPPIGFYYIHWFNLVLAFWALRSGETKTNAVLGYGFGVSLIVFNYYWITESVGNFSNLPVIVAWLCVFGYALLFAIPFSLIGAAVHWLRDRVGIAWLWLLPGLQVAIEQCWPALFPYYHGALFYKSQWFWQIASVFGVTSLTYLVFLTNAGLTEFLYRRRERSTEKIPLKSMGAIVALFMGTFIFGYIRHQSVSDQLSRAPTIRVSILQQSVTMKYRLERDTWDSIQDWRVLTDRILDQNPDLVIWPEGAMGGPYNPNEERPCYQYPHNVQNRACKALKNQSLHEYFSALSRDNNFDFLIGGGSITPFVGDIIQQMQAGEAAEYTATNSCYLFDRQGDVAGRYDKMILLPFGEYIPLADTFPIIKKLIQGPGSFKPGSEVTYFEAGKTDLRYRFSTPICYEAILNSQMRKMSDADIFVNITNDAWFGDTAASHQHGMLAAVQAIEWGRPMIRSAYTGISFFVEPHGDILYETKAFKEEAKVEPLRILTLNTVYRNGGWIFPWLWVLFWPLLFVFVYRRKPTIAEEEATTINPEENN